MRGEAVGVQPKELLRVETLASSAESSSGISNRSRRKSSSQLTGPSVE